MSLVCLPRHPAVGYLFLVRCLNVPTSPTDARMNESGAPSRKAVILGPGEGRSYPMGRIAAVFKADESEGESRYSISEWWLEAHTQGPGPHSHPEDDIFYVIEGTMSVLVGEVWTHATRGSFILVPGGVTHDFENRGETRAGGCSTFRYRVRLSRTCLPSRSGLPKIHPKMPASSEALQFSTGRRAERLNDEWGEW